MSVTVQDALQALALPELSDAQAALSLPEQESMPTPQQAIEALSLPENPMEEQNRNFSEYAWRTGRFPGSVNPAGLDRPVVKPDDLPIGEPTMDFWANQPQDFSATPEQVSAWEQLIETALPTDPTMATVEKQSRERAFRTYLLEWKKRQSKIGGLKSGMEYAAKQAERGTKSEQRYDTAIGVGKGWQDDMYLGWMNPEIQPETEAGQQGYEYGKMAGKATKGVIAGAAAAPLAAAVMGGGAAGGMLGASSSLAARTIPYLQAGLNYVAMDAPAKFMQAKAEGADDLDALLATAEGSGNDMLWDIAFGVASQILIGAGIGGRRMVQAARQRLKARGTPDATGTGTTVAPAGAGEGLPGGEGGRLRVRNDAETGVDTLPRTQQEAPPVTQKVEPVAPKPSPVEQAVQPVSEELPNNLFKLKKLAKERGVDISDIKGSGAMARIKERLKAQKPSEPSYIQPGVTPTKAEAPRPGEPEKLVQSARRGTVMEELEQKGLFDTEAPPAKLMTPKESPGIELHAGISPTDAYRAVERLETTQYLKDAFNRALAPARNRLKALGPAGETLARGLDESWNRTKDLHGKWATELEDTVRSIRKKYGRKELEKAYDQLDDVVRAQITGQPEPELSDAATELRDTWGRIYDEIGRLSEDVLQVYDPNLNGPQKPGWRPLRRIGESGFPRVLKKEYAENLRNMESKEYQEAFKYLKANNSGMTDDQIRKALAEAARSKTTGFFPGLEKARGVPLPVDAYEVNFRNTALRYIGRSSKRIADAEVFGQFANNYEEVINRVRGFSNQREALDIMQAYFDPPLVRGAEKLASATGKYQVLTKLSSPLSTAKNLTQQGNTIAAYGVKNWAKAYLHFGKSLQAYRRSGAKSERFLETIAGLGDDVDTLGNLSSKALKFSGFTPVERLNRIISSGAAAQWADDAAKMLAKGGKTAGVKGALKKSVGSDVQSVRRLMAKMNLDADAIAKRGYLTQEEVRRAAREGAKLTQFSTDFADLPLWASKPIAAPLRQFKTFSYHQARFFSWAASEAKQGNFKPLVMLLGVNGVGGGEMYRGLRSLVTNESDAAKNRRKGRIDTIKEYIPNETIAKVINRGAEDLMIIDTLGMFTDVYEDVATLISGNKTHEMRTFTPVMASSVKNLVNIVRIATDDKPLKTQRIIKTIGQEVPILGQARKAIQKYGNQEGFIERATAEPIWNSYKVTKVFGSDLNRPGYSKLEKMISDTRRLRTKENRGESLSADESNRLASMERTLSKINEFAASAEKDPKNKQKYLDKVFEIVNKHNG